MAHIPVEEIKTTNIKRSEPTLSGDVEEHVTRQEVRVDQEEYTIAKFKQATWFVIGIIELLILVRFLFLLLGANPVNFVDFVYDFTRIFVLPFVGIFEAGVAGESYFDVASLLAMAFWAVVGYIITWLLDILSKRNLSGV